MHGSQQIIAFSYDRLLELLHEYKKELGLQRWTIGLAIRRGYELGGSHGHVNIAETKTQAFIRILDPEDANPLEFVPYDMEVTLVHELLHCVFAPFTYVNEGSHENIVQEQGIDQASRSFVSMKRRVRELESLIPSGPAQLMEVAPRRRVAA